MSDEEPQAGGPALNIDEVWSLISKTMTRAGFERAMGYAADIARREERERCAVECEREAADEGPHESAGSHGHWRGALRCAERIRALPSGGDDV